MRTETRIYFLRIGRWRESIAVISYISVSLNLLVLMRRIALRIPSHLGIETSLLEFIGGISEMLEMCTFLIAGFLVL